MIPIDNDFDVIIPGLQQDVDGAWINDATINVSIFETTLDANGRPQKGTAVPSAEDVPAVYIEGTNAEYRATFPAALALTEGNLMLVEIQGVNIGFNYRFMDRVAYRG